MKNDKGSIPVRATTKASGIKATSDNKRASAPKARQKSQKFKHLRCHKTDDEVKKLNTIFTYNAGGNTAVRWCAYYYLPDGNKRKRIREYGGINKEKDPVQREILLNDLVNEIKISGRHLSNGSLKFSKNQELSCEYLVAVYLIEKKAINRKRAFETDEQILNYFIKYLKSKGLHVNTPGQMDKNVLHGYRMDRLANKVSNRTINNHMNAIKSFFNWVQDNYPEILPDNYAKKIKPLPFSSESHVAYTDEEARKISSWLNENDPETHLYTKFIVYAFLRPQEIEFVTVGDIDIENKKLLLRAQDGKTRSRMYKPLPEIFVKELIDAGILFFPKEYYVFSKRGGPGILKTTAQKFRERFGKMKEHFKFTNKHTMYGLRHTFVCQLLRNGMNPIEVMKYTGHTTLTSFMKYARSIMQGEAEDISDKYSVKY